MTALLECRRRGSPSVEAVEATFSIREVKGGQLLSGEATTCLLHVPGLGSLDIHAALAGPSFGELTLRYRIGSQLMVTTVKVEAVRQHLGGQRWWFLCPSTGARTARLYLPAGAFEFLSRDAHKLVYRSQRLKPAHRAAEKLRSLRRRSGLFNARASAEVPKGMHLQTVLAWLHRIEAAREALLPHLLQFAERAKEQMRWDGGRSDTRGGRLYKAPRSINVDDEKARAAAEKAVDLSSVDGGTD